MSYIRKGRVSTLIMLLAMAVISVVSCDNDDTVEPTLHQSSIQGKLNNHTIAINDVNANILINKSDYQFSSGNQTDIPVSFDWKVNLIESKDSIITLYLHIDDLKKTNEIIYSPNENDPIKTKSTCYVTVKDLKNNTTTLYHPTHTAPTNATWNTFMLEVNNDIKNPIKHYQYDVDFVGHRWPGIEGILDGVLTSDVVSKSPINISVKFNLY